MDKFMSGALIKTIPNLILWINSYNLKGSSCRYAKYKKEAENFFNEDINKTPHLYMWDLFRKQIYSFDQLMGLNYIYRYFKNEKSNGFVSRLEKMIKGPIFLSGNDNDHSRNIQFELIVSSYLSKLGYKFNFDSIVDVVAMRDGNEYFIECKKINSANQFRKRLKEATNQILKRREDKSNESMIFIDISNLVNFSQVSEYENEYQAKRDIKDNMGYLIKDNASYINTSLTENDKVILGICFFAQKPLYIGDTLTSVTEYDFRPSSNSPNNKTSVGNFFLDRKTYSDEYVALSRALYRIN